MPFVMQCDCVNTVGWELICDVAGTGAVGFERLAVPPNPMMHEPFTWYMACEKSVRVDVKLRRVLHPLRLTPMAMDTRHLGY